MVRMTRLLALAACCSLVAVAPARAEALGAGSSGERQAHTAAHAFDGSSATFWQSKSPAAGQYLTYTFPQPQTVLQYSLSGSSDVRWVAADGLVSWELQGSADGGATWSTIDRRYDERLWQPGETRVFSVKAPPGGDAALRAYPSFRLVVTKVPGRRVDESYAAVSELRFLTAENMPPFCDSLPDVDVNITVVGAPTPDAAGAGAPNYSLLAFVNVTNRGPNPLRLRGLHLPIRFSRAVQGWDGAWTAPPPRTFNASCWGAYLTDPSLLTDPWRARVAGPARDICRDAVTAEVTDWGVDLAFTSGILCPGCTLSGSPGGSSPMLAVQHASFGALDVGSAMAAPPACGAQPPRLPPLPLPGPERHPACAPWAAVRGVSATPPTCAPAAALAKLQTRLAFTYADGPGALPARELRLRPSITNTGKEAVDLFGVTIPISFSHRIKVDPAAPAWTVAPATAYQLDCFWAQVATAAGQPVFGQPNACELLTLNATSAGLEMRFQGGRLCAGCSLAGGTGAGDATLNVKHVDYVQMDVAPQPAVGATGCVALVAPPQRCADAVSPLAAAPQPLL